jgi:class 3 adenylate cyclase/predicted ATPase
VDIAIWLRELGLERYEPAFRDSEITAAVLPELTEADLKELGLPLGPRKLLLKAIASLPDGPAPESAPAPKAITREADRRQLTVLFCDLVGSTELSARLDPEDMGLVIRAYQACCTEIVARWGGHVAKYMGDGVLAYFGWPQAHEDEAERAVRAGLAIIDALTGLETPADEPLAARIGIATGLVMVGELIGEGAAQEQTVVGETPNLAARLQALATPGSIVISRATRRLLGGLFELADLGPHALKGFIEPMRAWRVVGAGAAESRFEALHGRHLIPLIGREEELHLLLARWRRAVEGEGQVVLLSGEAGIGKSRIVQALREQLAREAYTPLSHYCSPYHSASALYPIIALLERAAGFTRDDPPEARLNKLDALLAQGTDRLAEAVVLIADLLGLAVGERYPSLNLSPQRKAQRTLEVLAEQVEGLASRQPVLALYEDVHWIDPTTLEALGVLIERVQRLPVLVLITYRPDFVPPWSGHAHVTQLSLARLGRLQGAAIVERLTTSKPLPDEVFDQILAKTDGVPLFVEELTKAVLESGLLNDAGDHYELGGALLPLAIPATLQDSLTARLDRLAPFKEVAQIGAVIGREFSYELLAAVAGRSEDELRSALDQLVQSELIFRRGTPPDATYSFKHALVQDAAYQSLLKTKLQQLHARIAQILIERFPATVAIEPELVAYHFTQAAMAREAVEYWHRAGERAVKRSANLEAIRHLQGALDLLTSLPQDRTRAERELGLLALLGPAQMVTKSRAAEEVEITLERARDLARELASLDHLIPATLGLWLLQMNRGSFDRAGELTRELFDLANQGQDDGFALQAHHAGWTTPFFAGDFGEVRRHVELGLALYDRRRHGSHAFLYVGHDPLTCAHALGAVALWMLGYPEQAVRHNTAAVVAAEQLEHAPTLVHALSFAGILHVLRGDHEEVAKVAERLFSISSELGMAPGIATADSLAGWAMAHDRKAEEGLARLECGVGAWRATGARIHLPQRLSMLAAGLSHAGRPSEALDVNAKAHRLAQATGERWYEAMILWQRGQLLRLQVGDPEGADAALRESLEVAQGQRAKSVELRAATSLGRLWAESGERRKAYDLLAPIYGWFTEGFDTPDLKDAKALLDELR